MIVGFFGLPRSGKTAYMSYLAKKQMDKGVNVFSNYPLLGAYKLYFRYVVDGVLFPPTSILLFDEMQRYANSRDWERLSPELMFLFSQGGKMDLRLWYTSQDPSRVDKIIRENTSLAILVRPVLYADPLENVEIRITRGQILRRLLVIKRYNSIVELSTFKKGSVKFAYLPMKFFKEFNSFYAIEGLQNKKVDFEKWCENEME